MPDHTADTGHLETLRSRCFKAAADLYNLSEEQTDKDQRGRLRAKAQGVNLAISYIDEEIRRGR